MSDTNLNDIIENCIDHIYDCGAMYTELRSYIEAVANTAYALGFNDGKKHDSVGRKTDDTMDDLQSRGMKAVSTFLVRKGYEIITDDYDAFNEVDIVAYNPDNNSYHYVKVVVRDIGESSEEPPIDRKAAEADAIHYMSLHPDMFSDDADATAIVFDICTIMRAVGNKAMLRYHENVLDVL